jgi:hypothetical protein
VFICRVLRSLCGDHRKGPAVRTDTVSHIKYSIISLYLLPINKRQNFGLFFFVWTGFRLAHSSAQLSHSFRGPLPRFSEKAHSPSPAPLSLPRAIPHVAALPLPHGAARPVSPSPASSLQPCPAWNRAGAGIPSLCASPLPPKVATAIRTLVPSSRRPARRDWRWTAARA